MITIEQLLESVDLDFEPRFITQNKSGTVELWKTKPTKTDSGYWCNPPSRIIYFSRLKLAEFENKPWTECIYEVPRKTTGKIEKLLEQKLTIGKTKYEYPTHAMMIDKINELVVAVNKHADIIQQIGQWGNSKGECLWCETLTKFEPNELKGANQ